MNSKFWKGKKVLLTGHTGFKGTWLAVWLVGMGAKVCGYALRPSTVPSLFKLTKAEQLLKNNIGDIRDLSALKKVMKRFRPEIVIHMAAQPIVRESYRVPLETYETNVIGVVNLFEVVRSCNSVKVVLNVTTDKVYENKERSRGYREEEHLGGYDPYSASKACSEIVTASYRNSFFNVKNYKLHGVAVASARAGNVIGGGDWAQDRLVPDCISAVLFGKKLEIRNPGATRPWQHVLEPLSGYIMLCEKLYKNGPQYAGAWNIGPDSKECKSVGWIAEKFCELWGSTGACYVQPGKHPHEARFLKLDNRKAKKKLGWKPKWSTKEALEKVVEWTRVYQSGGDIRAVCKKQIAEYEEA